ncbi:hypothetical protein Tco_0711044 [Tanacetum coccineum]
MDQTSVPFIHRTLAVSVLAPRKTTLYLLCRHRSLPSKETVVPYLLRRPTSAPYLLRRLLLLTRGDCCSLPPEKTTAPYFLRRHCSLVISSRPEVAFVTPSIPVDRSNMEWSCLKVLLGPHLEVRLRLFRFRFTWSKDLRYTHPEVSSIGLDRSCLGTSIRGVWSGGFKCSSGVVGFHSEGSELEILIVTYDIPLDLRPRLLDPNFRMIDLPVEDTAIGIYSRIFDSSGVRIPFSAFLLAVINHFKVHIPKGDWFSFSKRGDPAPVCMEGVKHPDSCVTDEVPTDFNQDHVNRIKARIVKLRDIPEGVLVRSEGCDHTTSPTLAGAGIPHATPEETVITRPNRKVVTKADNVAKRKASTRPEVSTNVTKKTKSSKKRSGAGFSGHAAGCGVEQVDDDTLDDGDQRDDTEFVMEDIESLNDVSQGEHINVIPLRTFDQSIGLDVTYPLILLPGKEVEPHVELSGGGATPALDTQPQDADEDRNGSDDNVDSYYEAQVCNTTGDVLERDLLSLVPGPYYIPCPYDEGLGNDSPPYTKDD